MLTALLRTHEEGWTGANIFFVVTGAVLIVIGAVMLVLLGRAKRQETTAETDDRRTY
jgi:hypothetical protein